MAFDHELTVYFTSAVIQPYASVGSFLASLSEKAGELTGPRMDQVLREEYSPDFAEKLIGKNWHERVDDEALVWNEADGLHVVDPGFFVYATEINWEKGSLWAEWIPDHTERWDSLFPSDDLLGSDFPKAEFEARLKGLRFELDRIEMLLPNLSISISASSAPDQPTRSRSIGRPPKWDWEGALAFIVSEAQTPDGLPTGAGAQARIEEMIADWFVRTSGDAPSPSQIRERAASIIRSIETPKRVQMS